MQTKNADIQLFGTPDLTADDLRFYTGSALDDPTHPDLPSISPADDKDYSIFVDWLAATFPDSV